MRKPSPIRVWNWLAAAGLLFCLASFAAAQQTPKVGKDPATGHSTAQAQTAEPALHTPVREDENYLRAREEWFLQDRRLPDGSVGAGMRLKAIEYANQLLEDQRKMGLVPQEGAVAPIEGFLANTFWTGIGPAPIAVPGPFPSPFFPFFGSPVMTGRVSAIAVNPKNKDVVFLGAAAGGVWKSYYGAGILKSSNCDTTCTWTQQGASTFVGPFSSSRLDGAAHIGALAVDPFTPTIVLAGADFFSSTANSGIYRSIDGGTTWALTSLSGSAGTAIMFDVNNLGGVYAALGGFGASAGTNVVYRSTDHGANWIKLPGTGSNLFPATTSVGRIALALFPGGLTSTTIYAAVANSSGAFLGMFKSTDSGANWTQLTLPADPCSGQCSYDLAVAVDPVNPMIVYLGGSAGSFGSDSFINSKALVRSINGGATWRSAALGANLVHVHADLHALTFSADGRLYIGNDGGAWSSDNPDAAQGSVNYNNLNGTLAITMHYPGHGTVHFSDQNAGLVGEQDNGSARFSGSTTWDAVFPGGDGGQTAIDPIVPSAVYTTCQFICILRSLFDGISNSSYVEVYTNGIGGTRVGFIAPLTHDFNNSGRLYYGTNVVNLTTDYAERWDAISPDLTSGSPNVIRAIAAAPSDPSVVYVGTSASGDATPLPSKVQKTTNALAGTGATWMDITNSTILPTNRGVTSVFVDFNNSSLVYVTYGGFTFGSDTKNHVFRSPDAGVTWGDISGNLPNFPINDVFADPDVLNAVFVATDAGVYRTADASLGTSTVWSPVVGTDGKPLPNVIVFSLNGRRSRVLRAATSGRSIFDIQDTSVPIPAGPFLSSIRPSSALAGSGTVSGVVVDGANFDANSVVTWNGSTTGITSHPGTANQMTFDISASLLASATVADIRVFENPSGPQSKRLRFSVNGGAPTITPPLVPSSIASGSASFDLTVNGSGFVCAGAGGSGEVLFNGKPHKPTAGNCSPTSMKVTIDSSEVFVGGSVPVIAFAAPPGGGESNTVFFTITSAPPINDNFANALTASPTPFTDMRDTSAATTQTGEPIPPSLCTTGETTTGTHSIWYKVTPTISGTISADTHGSSYDTILQAVTGTLGSFTPIVCNDDTNFPADLTSAISFPANAGTTYFFMVSGFSSSDSGLAVFHLTFTPSSDFTISSPTGPQTILAGQSAMFSINVSAVGGTLANDVTFSLTGLPPASTGAFNPPSFLRGTNGGTSVLTISTTARSAMPPMQKPRPPRPNPLLWLLAVVLALMSSLLLRRGFRTRRLAVYLPLALLVLAVAFIAGCGGGGGGGGQ